MISTLINYPKVKSVVAVIKVDFETDKLGKVQSESKIPQYPIEGNIPGCADGFVFVSNAI